MNRSFLGNNPLPTAASQERKAKPQSASGQLAHSPTNCPLALFCTGWSAVGAGGRTLMKLQQALMDSLALTFA